MASLYPNNSACVVESSKDTSKRAAKYKRKISRLKRYAKELVHVNAALCDYISSLQETVVIRNQESKFLLAKLLQYKAPSECETVSPNVPKQNQTAASTQKSHSTIVAGAAAAAKLNLNACTPKPTVNLSSSKNIAGFSSSKTVVNSTPKAVNSIIMKHNQNTVNIHKHNSNVMIPINSIVKNSPPGKKMLPKKRPSVDWNESVKSSTKIKKPSITPRAKKVMQPITLDGLGRPVFPITLGGLTVHSLGEVVPDKPHYHTEDFIYPVGFCSTRVYGSIKDPEKKCIYTCKVLDGGSAPRFEIVADSDMNTPIVGSSASECHAMLLHHINLSVGDEVVETRGRGPEFFGFSHPSILNLVQSSPGTRKCLSYKWNRFEVNRTGEPLPEETDPSLSFESLQRVLALSRKHHIKVVKEEPSDQLTSSSNATLRDLLMS